MKWLPRTVPSRERGAALIIVLAFAVLLTALVLAYFSRTTSDRRLSHSSFHQSNVDQLAQSAMDTIIGDLQQEIVNGSVSPTPAAGPPYVPTSAANVVPQRSGNATTVPNLIRRSVSPDNILSPGLPSQASAVNSTTDASANGRFITSTRWNSHYLVPKKTIGTDDSVPIDDFTNATPDWVFITSNGATVITAPNPSVIGRYAYAVYDEGGLVDANVAGYPTGTSIYQYGRKGSLAFSDLTASSPYPILNPDTGNPAIYQVDRLVGWRNYGTAQPTNNFPVSNPASQAFAKNFQTSTASATWFYNYVVNNTSGFLGVRSDPSPTPYPWNYLNVTGDSNPATYPWNGRTDQSFIQRQELIAFRKEVGSTTSFSANALGYLGSFSREATAGAPQWSPATPTATNPNFQTLLVTGAFTRNDGTIASVGDPLVNKRFLLERLNWLTYKGPSATRTIPSSQPGSRTDPNWDMWLLTRRFGLTANFLQDSVVGGTAANIQKYFGLVWDATNERWNYTGPLGGSLASSIATFGVGGTQAATREPDFFELLQAGIILPSSVDDDYYSPDSTLLPVDHQKSKMLHILTIGANLIAQSRVDSYPVRIACNVGSVTMEAVGATRLPYLNSLAVCPVAGTATTGAATGGINWLLIPNLWDPFRDTWDLTEQNASSTLTPNYLRPPVRITVSGSVGLGTVLAGPSVKTGIVSSALVTPSPSPTAVVSISPAQSLALSTPTASPGMGRNGFLEASRISTSDVTPAPPAFVTTTSVTAAVAQWANVPYPSPTGTPTPVGANVVFRVSFPGTSIPASWASPTPAQNPVLVLQPGFQITVDYQSPNGQWYSYSFLQGNSASPTTDPSATPHATWISGGNPVNPGLNLTTSWSVYGRNPSPSPTPATTPLPTILLTSPSPTAAPATLSAVTALAEAPMFAKADPRSMRYNSQVGVLHLASPAPTASPTASPFTAGIIRSIWPSGFAAPPIMTVGASSAPTPTPTPTPTATPTQTPLGTLSPPNPAVLGDSAPAGTPGNPYNEFVPPGQTVSVGDSWRPIIMNRPFRSVGEMGYAFRDQPFRTLSFSSANSSDAALLDLFSVNDYSDPSSMRAGVISLNSQQPWALAAVLGSTIKREDTPRSGSPGSPTPQPLTTTEVNNTAASLASLSSSAPVINRAGLATLAANVPDSTGLGPSQPKTQRESIARALGEASQTRTWNLLIDVIAQSGQYPPNATNFQNGFFVNGEQHYWVHVAIDRFTGQVIDKQIEVVNE
jgi:Tfp pilus assembly protein PilX